MAKKQVKRKAADFVDKKKLKDSEIKTADDDEEEQDLQEVIFL